MDFYYNSNNNPFLGAQPYHCALNADDSADGHAHDASGPLLPIGQHHALGDSNINSGNLLAAVLQQHGSRAPAQQQQQSQQHGMFADVTNQSNSNENRQHFGAPSVSALKQQQQQQQQYQYHAQMQTPQRSVRDANNSSSGSNDESPSARIMRGVLDTIADTPDGRKNAAAEKMTTMMQHQQQQQFAPPQSHFSNSRFAGVSAPVAPPHQHQQQPSSHRAGDFFSRGAQASNSMHVQHQQQQHQQPLRESIHIAGSAPILPPAPLSRQQQQQHSAPASSSAAQPLSSNQFVVSATASQCSTATSRTNSPPQPHLAPPPQHQQHFGSASNGSNSAPASAGSTLRASAGGFVPLSSSASQQQHPARTAGAGANRFNTTTTTATSSSSTLMKSDGAAAVGQQFAAASAITPVVAPSSPAFFAPAQHASPVTSMHDFSLQLVVEFKLERRIRVRATQDFARAEGSYVIVDLDHGLGIDSGLCIGVFAYQQRHTIPHEWQAGKHAAGRAVRVANAADCERINGELARLEEVAVQRAYSLARFLHYPFQIIDAEVQFDLSSAKIYYAVVQTQGVTVPNLARLQRELSHAVGVQRVFLEQLVDLDAPDVQQGQQQQHQQQHRQHQLRSDSSSGAGSSQDHSCEDVMHGRTQ